MDIIDSPPLATSQTSGGADLSARIQALVPDMVECRRAFHAWPELSFQELRTAAVIADQLQEMGLEVQTGVAKTGVVALLRGGRPGKTLLVRSDIDALPLEERTDVPYRSRNPGVMHACGHDAHMAMLLTAIRILTERRDDLAGCVKFVFQPAEEGPGGADLMIEEGVLENPRVDAAIGYHIWNELPVGVVGLRSGALMASSDELTITVKGKGGHGADPHLSLDAVVIAAHIITALQTVVSRQVSPLTPAVLTIGKLLSGSGHNIIAQEAVMSGTVRTFCEAVRAELPRRIEAMVRGVCDAFGADYDFEYSHQYPVTINDPWMTQQVRQSAITALGPGAVVEAEPTMGSEDMAYFLREVPGCYFLIGSANPAKGLDKPHHHPEFDIDEDALPVGVKVLVQSILDFLEA